MDIVQHSSHAITPHDEPFQPLVNVSHNGSKERKLAMGMRQVLIMALGLLEDYLDLPRSIVPSRKRDNP